jgi:SAM-dependent methyltransferase
MSSQGEPAVGDLIDGACWICGNPKLRVLPFRYAFRERFLVGVRCSSCSMVFVHPQPSSAEISEMYGEDYFTECSETCGAHGPSAYMEMAGESGVERSHGARRLDVALLRLLGTRGALLEIGCGPGFFLAEMRNLGWHPRGLEISEYAVRHAREKLGLDVVQGSLEPRLLPLASFDAVFMGDVMEHLSNPIESLAAVHSWLKPGGVLLVAIPSTMNLLSARLGMAIYQTRRRFKTLRIPPYHLFEYTPSTARETLRRAGFSVVGLRQSAVPLRRMGLRGTVTENLGKVSLQILAHLTSRIFNRGGDRLLLLCRRHGD